MELAVIFAVSGLVLYSLVLYRLLTTNHWTTGKKLLVVLVFSIMMHYSMLIFSLTEVLPLVLKWTSVPVSAVGLVMVSLFYRLEDIEH